MTKGRRTLPSPLRRALSAAAVVMPALTGCYTGPTAEGFTPAITPYGIAMELTTWQGSEPAELLEVRDTAFVVLSDAGVTLVSFTMVRGARFAGYPLYYTGGVPTSDVRAELRMLSRYPQGLSSEQLARLLAAYRQRELRRITP